METIGKRHEALQQQNNVTTEWTIMWFHWLWCRYKITIDSLNMKLKGTIEILIPLCSTTNPVRYIKFRNTLKGL